jgi:hypothetical protein
MASSVVVTIENNGPGSIRVSNSGGEIPPGDVLLINIRELVSIRLDSNVASLTFTPSAAASAEASTASSAEASTASSAEASTAASAEASAAASAEASTATSAEVSAEASAEASTATSAEALTLLCEACAAGDLDVVAAAKKVLSADDLRWDNNRPILCASANGQLAAAQRVFETFGLTAADLRVRGDNALWLACSSGHLAVAKWLTRVGRLKVEDVLAVRRTFEDAAEAQTDREYRWQVGLNTIRDLLAEFTIGTE